MRIRYTLRAFADRETIYGYLERRNPRCAQEIKQHIDGAIRGLVLFPRVGQLTSWPGVYVLNIPRLPYKIYYRIEGEQISILHIRHAARQPWAGEVD